LWYQGTAHTGGPDDVTHPDMSHLSTEGGEKRGVTPTKRLWEGGAGGGQMHGLPAA